MARQAPKGHDMTQTEVENVIKVWLRSAGDRGGGREKRRSKRYCKDLFFISKNIVIDCVHAAVAIISFLLSPSIQGALNLIYYKYIENK